jgi:hypothetical protein
MKKLTSKKAEQTLIAAVTYDDVIYRSNNGRYNFYPQQGNVCVPDKAFARLQSDGYVTSNYPAKATNKAHAYVAAFIAG